MGKLLHWATSRLRLRVITFEGKPYLERYYLGGLFGGRAYIHRFVDSDPGGQGLHDHPWAWSLSLVLAGWYFEHRRSGLGTIFFWNFIAGDKFHRVELPPEEREVWTLFIHGPRRKPWGFLQQHLSAFGEAYAVWEEKMSADGETTRWWESAPQARFHPLRALPGNPEKPS